MAGVEQHEYQAVVAATVTKPAVPVLCAPCEHVQPAMFGGPYVYPIAVATYAETVLCDDADLLRKC